MPKIVCVVIALSLFWGLKIVVLETTKSPVLLSFVVAYVDIGRSDTANSPSKGKSTINPTIPYIEIQSVLLVFKFSVDDLYLSLILP
jgi:hypothetical protein